jgi:predicted NAD/FAD-binding protein
MRIAVIGSGIAGLAAVEGLGAGHEVVLFERHGRPGMDAHSVALPGGVTVDVPLRVFYPGYYPTLLALYRRAGVAMEAADYASSFSDLAGRTYFRYENLAVAGRSLPYLPRAFALRPRAWRIGAELVKTMASVRIGRLAPEGDETLAAYCGRRDLDRDFVDGFLFPAYASIATCSYAALAEYPAAVVLDYMTRGVFSSGVTRSAGGTAAVVERLLAGRARVQTDARVVALSHDGDGVMLRAAGRPDERFDHVIVATQANQAAELLGPEDPVKSVLLAFHYERSRLVLHSDASLMPARRAHWSSVNFFTGPGAAAPMATIWMNRVQRALRDAPDVFQTWNPLVTPAAERVISEATFERPVVTGDTLRAVRELREQQQSERRRIWFCGSYAQASIPLLESAAASAGEVARRIERVA